MLNQQVISPRNLHCLCPRINSPGIRAQTVRSPRSPFIACARDIGPMPTEAYQSPVSHKGHRAFSFRVGVNSIQFNRRSNVGIKVLAAAHSALTRAGDGSSPSGPNRNSILRWSPCWYGPAAVNRHDTGSIPVAAACWFLEVIRLDEGPASKAGASVARCGFESHGFRCVQIGSRFGLRALRRESGR